MSHEGVKILSSAPAAERVLTRQAVEPLKVRVDKSGGTGVEIVWQDGHASQWTFAWLRNACPCAMCADDREKYRLEPGQPKPEQKPANALPMFKEPPRPREVSAVGHYAVRFSWNDGHESGIYSWDYLRRVCQCADCVNR